MNDSPILYLENYRRCLQMRKRFMTESEYRQIKDEPVNQVKCPSLPLRFWALAYGYSGILSFLIGYFLRQ